MQKLSVCVFSCIITSVAQRMLATGCGFYCYANTTDVTCLPESRSTPSLSTARLHAILQQPHGSIQNLQAGCAHACITHGLSALTCFGSNEKGQLLGHVDLLATQHTIVLNEPIELFVGNFYTCFTTQSGGTLRCWGVDVPDGLQIAELPKPPSTSPLELGTATHTTTATETSSTTSTALPSDNSASASAAVTMLASALSNSMSDTAQSTMTSSLTPVPPTSGITETSSSSPTITSSISGLPTISSSKSSSKTSSRSVTTTSTVTRSPSPSASPCNHGGSAAYAARSTAELFSCGVIADGFYWLLFDTEPRQVYCEMSQGGWMYVMPPRTAPLGHTNPFNYSMTSTANDTVCSDVLNDYMSHGSWLSYVGYRCGLSTLYLTFQINNPFNATQMKLSLILNGAYVTRSVLVNGQSITPPDVNVSVISFYGTYNNTCGTNNCWITDGGLIHDTTSPFAVPVSGDITLQVGGCCAGYTMDWGIGIAVWQLALR